MRRRIAHIGRDRLHSVLGPHPADELRAPGERVVPARLDEVPRRVAHQGHAQPVGVGVEVPQGGALGADVALGPHVVAVRADQLDLAAVVVHFQPAHRLAERARPDMDVALGHRFRLASAATKPRAYGARSELAAECTHTVQDAANSRSPDPTFQNWQQNARIPCTTLPIPGSGQTSSIRVTGPSLMSSTAMSAPKEPVATVAPRRRSSSTSTSIRRFASSGAAAAMNDGRRPLRVSP